MAHYTAQLQARAVVVLIPALLVVFGAATPQGSVDVARVKSAVYALCAADAIPQGARFKKVIVVRDCVVADPVAIRGDKAEAWFEYIALAELVPGPILQDLQSADGSHSPGPIKVRGAFALTRTADGWSAPPSSPGEVLATSKGVAAYLSQIRETATNGKVKRRAQVALKQLQKVQ